MKCAVGGGGWRRYTARAHRYARESAAAAAAAGWLPPRGGRRGLGPGVGGRGHHARRGLAVGKRGARTGRNGSPRARSVGCVRLVGDTGRSSVARPPAARTVPRQAGGCPPAVRPRAWGGVCMWGRGVGV